jgi:hypothetical protein
MPAPPTRARARAVGRSAREVVLCTGDRPIGTARAREPGARRPRKHEPRTAKAGLARPGQKNWRRAGNVATDPAVPKNMAARNACEIYRAIAWEFGRRITPDARERLTQRLNEVRFYEDSNC